jgi:hypothetical protein
VLELHGWAETGEKLSAHAARGEWAEMSELVSDEMLAAFMTEADSPKALAAALKERYQELADRLTLYLPFTPGDKDEWWQELVTEFK